MDNTEPHDQQLASECDKPNLHENTADISVNMSYTEITPTPSIGDVDNLDLAGLTELDQGRTADSTQTLTICMNSDHDNVYIDTGCEQNQIAYRELFINKHESTNSPYYINHLDSELKFSTTEMDYVDYTVDEAKGSLDTSVAIKSEFSKSDFNSESSYLIGQFESSDNIVVKSEDQNTSAQSVFMNSNSEYESADCDLLNTEHDLDCLPTKSEDQDFPIECESKTSDYEAFDCPPESSNVNINVISDFTTDAGIQNDCIDPEADTEEPIGNPMRQESIPEKSASQSPSKKRKKSKDHTCRDCGKQFVWQSNLDQHKLTHSGEKPYECVDCGRRFTRQGNLNSHQRIHLGLKPFCCNDCGKTFHQRSDLTRHELIHSGVKPFCCPECGKQFKQRNHLENHKLLHSGIKPYSCDICQKQFTQKSSLYHHQVVHTGLKPFLCTDCGKQFSQKCHLNDHQLVHLGVKPVVCTECGKQFTRNSHLKEHRLIHSGEKPFSCTECGKQFTQRSNLKKHQMIHTGSKPFSCVDCGKQFTQRGHLKQHRLIHTGD